MTTPPVKGRSHPQAGSRRQFPDIASSGQKDRDSPAVQKSPGAPSSIPYFNSFGVNFPPLNRTPSSSADRASQFCSFSGVKLLCSDSTIGIGSLATGIWLSAVQMPAGGETVSMNPIAASTGALMREAKLIASK